MFSSYSCDVPHNFSAGALFFAVPRTLFFLREYTSVFFTWYSRKKPLCCNNRRSFTSPDAENLLFGRISFSGRTCSDMMKTRHTLCKKTLSQNGKATRARYPGSDASSFGRLAQRLFRLRNYCIWMMHVGRVICRDRRPPYPDLPQNALTRRGIWLS